MRSTRNTNTWSTSNESSAARSAESGTAGEQSSAVFILVGRLPFHEERIGLAFFADGGERAVAGHDDGFVGEGHERVVQ